MIPFSFFILQYFLFIYSLNLHIIQIIKSNQIKSNTIYLCRKISWDKSTLQGLHLFIYLNTAMLRLPLFPFPYKGIESLKHSQSVYSLYLRNLMV